MTKKNEISISTVVDRSIVEQFKKIAAQDNRSIAYLVRKVITEYVKNNLTEVDSKQNRQT